MQNRRGLITGAVMSVGAMAMLSACATTNAAAPAPISFNVIYPNHEGARFDMAYYTGTHIPLVMRVMGATRVTLIEGTPSATAPAPFVMIAHFEFPSTAALEAALAKPEMTEVRADVARFTDIRPTILRGKTP